MNGTTQKTAKANGWHLVDFGGSWIVRYFNNGKWYRCEPRGYADACASLSVYPEWDTIRCDEIPASIRTIEIDRDAL